MVCQKREIPRLIRRVLTCVLCLMFGVYVGACKEKTPPPPPPPTVTVAQPVQRTVTDYLELTGNTRAIKTVQLVARVAGYLDKVFFQDGQFVKEGQLLFLIQQNTYQDNLRQTEAAILQQKARLEYAEIQLARYSKLVQEKAASQTDVDNWRYQRDSAQANLQAAEAQRDLAKLNLGYTEVRSPFDGRIDRRQKDPGNLVGSGENTVLAEINQINPIYVYFNISDADLARLIGETHWTPGQARAVKWPVLGGLLTEKEYPHKGQLDFASISLTSTTGTLLMRGVFSNPDGKILPGLYARVHVPVKEGPAFLVPQEAIGYDQRGSYVLMVNENNVVQRSSVRIGTLVDHLRVVEEGLTGNEWVVIRGVQKAIPGRQVTPEREGVQRPGIGSPQSQDQRKVKP
ncbi:MAG TPA: efflux RND transporter periplasmic adaptor subunit [Thermodesulfobacteriota bacterium]|nr:efflux RND transporter periplasmic adaptor subunit [Thermodesulfobacteriota bacterium]